MEIKDYVLLMLGAPVVKVELDESQLELCVSRVCDFMDQSAVVAGWEESRKVMEAQDGALAHAKLMLGRIRNKFRVDPKGVTLTSTPDGAIHSLPADGERLLDEGEREYKAWRANVFGKSF